MKELNLEIVAKDYKTYTLRLKRNGVAIDISGWSLYFTAKQDFNDLDAAAKISKNVLFSANAESEAGIGYLTLSSSDTDLPVGELYYDAKFLYTGVRKTFLRGKLIIVPSIRKA
jgi:hypothetical protein